MWNIFVQGALQDTPKNCRTFLYKRGRFPPVANSFFLVSSSSYLTMTVLVDPNFKSSLPPRKRAKTDEEKEQRRVERILRNRRAAHASREKKRKHVEYLEAYVLALESNMSTLTSNFNRLKSTASPEKVAELALPKLEDLSELRDRIHSNMTTSCPSNSLSGSSLDTTDGASYPDMDLDPEAEGGLDSTNHNSPIISVKKEPLDDSMLSAPSTGYYNYLSPVSITSPMNSPINLTLKSHDASSSSDSDSSPNTPEMSTLVTDGLILGPSTSSIDYMAQNSEVILSPRVLMV